ncbi:LysE family translocator [Cohnella faecalis]|nr:LysE family transporter [Cohnella faecalis]
MAALHSFTQGFLFSLSLCFDLGIVNVAIMKTGIERGIKPSFLIGFGSCFGDLTYLALALLGVGVIFQIAWVEWTLWIVGSVALFYLTFKALRETWRPKEFGALGAAVVRSPVKDWTAGLGLALSSPSVIAWFALVAGPIVSSMRIHSGFDLTYFVLGFFAAGVLWSLAVALVSSSTGKLFRGSIVRFLSLGSAILFLYFAIRIFAGGLQNLVLAP